MAKDELVRALDYILNRCGEAEIEAVAAAVIRRRRDIAMFGSMPDIPDPGRMAKEMSSQLNIEGSIEDLKNQIRDYAVRIIKQEAPELTDDQISELCGAWIPSSGGKDAINEKSKIPRDALASMISQFVSFSLGRMDGSEDESLRKEMGSWPEKYWKSFPSVIRLLITDFLKGEINEKDFNSRLSAALSM